LFVVVVVVAVFFFLFFFVENGFIIWFHQQEMPKLAKSKPTQELTAVAEILTRMAPVQRDLPRNFIIKLP